MIHKLYMASIRIKIPGVALIALLVCAINAVVGWAQVDRPVALQLKVPRTALQVGESVQLSIMAEFPDGTAQNVIASSLARIATNDKRLAMVTEDGILQALSTGGPMQVPLEVAASYHEFGIQMRLTLFQKGLVIPSAKIEVPIGFKITVPKATLREGETVQLKVIAEFANGLTKDVTSTSAGTKYFTTSLGRLATVNSNGLIRAVSTEGQTSNADTIWVMYQSFKAVIALTTVKADALYISAPKTILRVGETVQLKVIQKLPDGPERDLTDPRTGTTYQTTSESVLIPEPDGRVTSIGTRGKSEESAIVGVQNGKLAGDINFILLSGGPGPSLEVTAEKTVLRESEKTQFHVYKRSREDSRNELTATSTGTHYLTFTGFGRHDPSVISIDENGLASATDSIEGYNRRTVTVFVRNGNDVGWTELTVLPKGSRGK